MRYLLTGHPRVRSAWLAALCSAHGSKCIHDAHTYGIDLSTDIGFSDPGLGCRMPEDAFSHCRGALVVIERPGTWRAAFEAAFECPLTDEFVEQCERNLATMKGLATRVYHVDQLADDNVVAEIVETLTGLEPDYGLIEIWQHLQIEQHRAKAYDRSPLPFPSVI